MKDSRKLLFPCAGLLGVALGMMHFIGHLPSRTGGDWVRVSKPVFTKGSDSGKPCFLVSFVVSNVGPQRVDFGVDWLEAMDGNNRKLVQHQPAHPDTSRQGLPLKPGESTNVVVEFGSDYPTDPVPVFCCEVRWFEGDSMMRRSFRGIRTGVVWLGECFGTNWNPVWLLDKPHAAGVRFTSNVEVRDFFRRVHGFTRTGWLQHNLVDKADGGHEAVNAFCGFCTEGSGYELDN